MTQLEMMTSTELSGSGMFSISPFRNSTLSMPGLALVFVGQRQHFVGHVEAVGLAGGADAPCGEQDVDAAAGAEVEHDLTGIKLGQARSDCRSRARPAGLLGDLPDLRDVVEVRGNRDRSNRCWQRRAPQQDAARRCSTRSAASPYFSFTTSLMSVVLMIGLLFANLNDVLGA